MVLRTLVAVSLAGLAPVATQAWARTPAPLVATALVEDVKSAAADVEFMDYVGPGQVIKLGSGDVLVLSYLKSCEYETITGGTVTTTWLTPHRYRTEGMYLSTIPFHYRTAAAYDG